MKLQKGKWYVCTKNWGDDGWVKFWEGTLLRCKRDNEMVDCYDIKHLFLEDDEPERIFREASDIERNLASATEIDMNEWMEPIRYFEPTDTLLDIYRKGAERMLEYIKASFNIKDLK